MKHLSIAVMVCAMVALAGVRIAHAGNDCWKFNYGNGVCAGQFQSVGNMTTKRSFHTATLLNDGTVLIAGGSETGGEVLTSSAELFNPATKSFSATTGSMKESLASQTATLLLNGEVLIDGGDNGTATVADAELYNPANQTFSFTGSMKTPRVFNTLTLFTSGPLQGQVLVTGGLDNSNNALNSAELYDPSTGMFTLTSGAMNVARSQHTATLLPDGEVLIAGGIDTNGNSLASAELFDPATQTFTLTGSMNTARGIHNANLLPGGNVLITGGIDLVAGNGPVLSSAEIFHNGAFVPIPDMRSSREDFTATTLSNNWVLMTGGTDNNNDVLSSAEIYQGRNFENTASMNAVRWFHTATLLLNSMLQGDVLITGGLNASGDNALKSAEIFAQGSD